MDKIGLGLVEETDEELYELLGKAMEEERLCVSEELIQKTLKRAEESPASTGVNHKSRNYTRLIRWGSVAAAAVLVVLIGGRMFDGAFRMGKSESDCAPNEMNSLNGVGITSEKEMGIMEPAGSTYFYRCFETAVDSYDMAVEATESVVANESKAAKDWDVIADSVLEDAQTDDAGSGIQAETITLSAEFCELLAGAGYTVTDTTAQFWCLNPLSAKHWEEETRLAIAEEAVLDRSAAEAPAVKGGSISSGQPLYYAVQLITAEDNLWILVGEKVYFITER